MLLNDAIRLKVLTFLLRIAGAFTAMAFLTMLLPVEWMASMHQRLGLGELPRAPIVDYLARSIAALYGFHGVLLLILSTDPSKYRTIVNYVALLNVIFGVMLLVIDLHAGMPTWWIAAEGPPVTLFGVVLAVLNNSGSDSGREPWHL